MRKIARKTLKAAGWCLTVLLGVCVGAHLFGACVRSCYWYFFVQTGVEELGGGYLYTIDSARNIIGPKVAIPPQILNYSYNEDFIIVKQTLNGRKPQWEYLDECNYNYPSLDGLYYWIIDKKNDTFYGPLKFQEYIGKRDSLNVELLFNPVKEKLIRNH